MSIIAEDLENEHTLSKRIREFFRENQIGQLLKEANAYKGKGIPVVQVLMYSRFD